MELIYNQNLNVHQHILQGMLKLSVYNLYEETQFPNGFYVKFFYFTFVHRKGKCDLELFTSSKFYIASHFSSQHLCFTLAK